jgi:hypothetical protein
MCFVDRRLIVTLLDVGSVEGFMEIGRCGVCGGCGSPLPCSFPSSGVAESCLIFLPLAASAERLREPPLETRWRFRADCSSWSKGFGRVEQGSEETARLRDHSGGSRSIWPKHSAKPAVNKPNG